MLEVLLIAVALVFYAARYALSGVDNGLYYWARKTDGAWKFRPPDGLPDVHWGESLQQLFAHLSTAILALLVVLVGEWRWPAIVGILLAMNGASQFASSYFQRFIQIGVGHDEETGAWDLTLVRPRICERKILGVRIKYISLLKWERWILWVPKPFANRRPLQKKVAAGIYVAGIVILLLDRLLA